MSFCVCRSRKILKEENENATEIEKKKNQIGKSNKAALLVFCIPTVYVHTKKRRTTRKKIIESSLCFFVVNLLFMRVNMCMCWLLKKTNYQRPIWIIMEKVYNYMFKEGSYKEGRFATMIN